MYLDSPDSNLVPLAPYIVGLSARQLYKASIYKVWQVGVLWPVKTAWATKSGLCQHNDGYLRIFVDYLRLNTLKVH